LDHKGVSLSELRKRFNLLSSILAFVSAINHPSRRPSFDPKAVADERIARAREARKTTKGIPVLDAALTILVKDNEVLAAVSDGRKFVAIPAVESEEDDTVVPDYDPTSLVAAAMANPRKDERGWDVPSFSSTSFEHIGKDFNSPLQYRRVPLGKSIWWMIMEDFSNLQYAV
jgi:hypothetical protein